mmetsp:Transcript_36026/g.87063  ORF Transcript_36026/g.87063 Transcript_36026/m.87063 type:complete len:84 (-) Transcript_36026:234-485(-)
MVHDMLWFCGAMLASFSFDLSLLYSHVFWTDEAVDAIRSATYDKDLVPMMKVFTAGCVNKVLGRLFKLGVVSQEALRNLPTQE